MTWESKVTMYGKEMRQTTIKHEGGFLSRIGEFTAWSLHRKSAEQEARKKMDKKLFSEIYRI